MQDGRGPAPLTALLKAEGLFLRQWVHRQGGVTRATPEAPGRRRRAFRTFGLPGSSQAFRSVDRNPLLRAVASGDGVDIRQPELIGRGQNGHFVISGACVVQAIAEVEAAAA